MSEPENEGTLHLAVAVARLPQDGLPLRFEADEAQRAAVAARFGILDVERLEADLFVARWQRDGVRVDGDLTARVLQTDIVTLEPVRQAIAEAVDLFFLPAHSPLAPKPSSPDEEIDIDPGDEAVEFFRGDRIDLGEPLVQLLGLALDPYPRGADVAFEEVRQGEPEPSPFAVLARLREPKKD